MCQSQVSKCVHPCHNSALVCLSLQHFFGLRVDRSDERLRWDIVSSHCKISHIFLSDVSDLTRSVHWIKSSLTAPVKMSETIFEGFEKIGKKQNKEQVPPPAETQQKKLNAAKQQTKKSQPSTSSKPTHYKTLEEAVKAVSTCDPYRYMNWFPPVAQLCGRGLVCVVDLFILTPSLCGWLYFSPFSFPAGCGGVEATAGEKSSLVPWESVCLGEGPGRVSQQQTARTRHGSHAQQPRSRCVSDSALNTKALCRCMNAVILSLFQQIIFYADYPYCLAGKDLRSIIKNLLGKSGDTLQEFFDHCVLTMLRELDRPTGNKRTTRVR